MKKKSLTDSEILRQRAEKQLKLKGKPILCESEMQKLIHELEVHQMELEMQNQKLILAVEQAELNQKKYTSLYDFATSGYITLSTEGDIIELNYSAADMLGRNRNQLINSRFGFFISDETKPVFNLFFQKVFKSKTKETCEVILSKEPNSSVDIQIEGIVAQNHEQCILTLFDISERKQAEVLRKRNEDLKIEKEKIEYSEKKTKEFLNELTKVKEKLEKNEQRLKIATISGQLGIWDWNVKDNTMLWDDRMFELYGISRNTFSNQVNAWENCLHPEDRQRAVDECNLALTGEKLYNTVFRILHSDGKILYIKADGLVIRDENNKPVRMIGINRDISIDKLAEQELIIAKEKAEVSEEKHRMANERFMKFASQVKGMLYQFERLPDGTFRVPFTTDAIIDIFGCTPEEVKNDFSPVAKVIHPDDIPLMLEKIEESYQQLTPFHFKYRVIYPTLRWIQAQSIPEKLPNGSVVWSGFNTDITEIKNSELELLKAKEKAEESDRLKTQFLLNMSHEIKTPMNAINGFSNMLNKPDLPAEKRTSFTSIIIKSSNQLQSIVENILTISALETKQEKVTIEQVCINNIIVDLLTIAKMQAQNQNISLYTKQQLTDKQSEIYTDKIKVIQILTNLLTNALKFTNSGYIEIGYNLKDNEIEFYVKDTGIGIIPEMQERIFERFIQVETGLTRQYGGNGLGLSISKGLVELLGGRIWLQSEPGKGSTFSFTIPYKPVHEIDRANLQALQDSNFPTILVAEDEAYNFLYIEELLFDLKFKLIHAKDGQEAVEICKNNADISLILMDIKMPLMNGHIAAEKIKAFRPNLIIIAQSAYTLEQYQEKYEGNVFDDYIAKPLQEDELKQIVMKYIDLSIVKA